MQAPRARELVRAGIVRAFTKNLFCGEARIKVETVKKGDTLGDAPENSGAGATRKPENRQPGRLKLGRKGQAVTRPFGLIRSRAA